MPTTTLILSDFEKTVALGDSKDAIVAHLGQPDADGGNGCFTEWPDVMAYEEYELHFFEGKLRKVSKGGTKLLE